MLWCRNLAQHKNGWMEQQPGAVSYGSLWQSPLNLTSPLSIKLPEQIMWDVCSLKSFRNLNIWTVFAFRFLTAVVRTVKERTVEISRNHSRQPHILLPRLGN